jgi:F-type H+-transporting ATPase subunit b
MNINLTLLGQTITFIVFVAFCMKYIWPPLMKVLNDRKKQIADGLAAGEKGQHDLELAQRRATEVIHEAKQKASEIITHAEQRAGEIADEAKDKARDEADRIVRSARADIDQEVNQAREGLRKAVSQLAIVGAGKILEKEVDPGAHAKLIDGLVREL